MPKRRRERDRPKHAPENPYDPHKRVLLSYDSSDEDVEIPPQHLERAAELTVEQSRPASDASTQRKTAEVTMGAGEPSAATTRLESEDQATPVPLEHNRDLDTEPPEEIANAEPKADMTRRAATDGGHARTGKIDIGQRQALGAMLHEYGDDSDGNEYDSATEDAMAYLESVRSEREAIPEILAAVRQVSDASDAMGEEDDADEDWPIDDDTHTPAIETAHVPVDETTEPQKVFTKCLKDRFILQRKHLQMAASPARLAELGEGFPTSYVEGNNKSRAEWHRILGSKSPMPAQLRAMDQSTVFNLLALLQESYLVKGRNIKKVTSAWIWALLCRLDDVGNMNNDQVFPLRELGRKIVFLQLCFLDPETAAQLELLERQDLDAEADTSARGDGNAQSFGQANGQHTKGHNAEPTENTLATLEMILVVVGDLFGQRDLLEFRHQWTKTEAEAAT